MNHENNFSEPSIDVLAKRLAQLSPGQRALLEKRLQKKSSPSTPQYTIPHVPQRHSAPLTFSQQRMWFMVQMEPNSAVYNLSFAFCLEGNLNISALQQALNTMLERHQALRTIFQLQEGTPVQLVTANTTLDLGFTDARSWAAADRTENVQVWLKQLAHRPFDLASDLMLRGALLQTADHQHILLMVMHHIVSDGWSRSVFKRELSLLYNAFAQGQSAPLSPLPVQYLDFAAWQQEYLTDQVLETQLDYWREELAAAPVLLNLPLDRPRPALQTFVGSQQKFYLDRSLTLALKQLSQQSGVTLYMTLLAAFATLLFRYSGQEDILIGSPIANRNHPEIEPLIGFFVNTLILRARLSDEPSFTELLSRVRKTTLDAFAHKDMPFEELSIALRPQRDASHSLWFQAFFVLQNTPSEELNLFEISATPVSIGYETTQFDLTLSMVEEASGLQGAFHYNSDLFEASTILRMIEHLQVLITEIVKDPQRSINRIPILPGQERAQILNWATGPQTAQVSLQCIHQLFEKQVEQTPQETAIAYPDPTSSHTLKALSYTDLNRQANQLARHLQTLGVEKDVLVGLCVERSPAQIIALLAILKAGGAYVPLDPQYPSERLNFMIADAHIGLLVTQASNLNQFPNLTIPTVCLDRDWPIVAVQADQNLDLRFIPEQLAYVIYTSGSTGTPKGVMVPHRALVNFTSAAIARYGIQESDRILQFASISFDAAAEEIFPALSSGSTLVLRNDNILSSTAQFLKACQDWQLTILDLPTAFWQQLVSELINGAMLLPPSLRLVIIGGERVSPQTVRHWQATVGNYPQLLNTYGPTEATVVATTYTIHEEAPILQEVPIGQPLANIQTYVLNTCLQLVPMGIPGELYIGGPGVAHGYLNRPDLTETCFIPDPFSDCPQARLYKTGDLVRWLSNGDLEFLGRIDNQVKIRGFRVELGEVEAVIAQSSEVEKVVVTTLKDESSSPRLVAYVVPKAALNPDDLRQFLKQKLPDYMVPSAFIAVEALPMTPSGKVDYPALPSPSWSDHYFSPAFQAPQGELEITLTRIWEKVLNIQPIGRHDSFFDLGGHSLLAIKLFSQIEKELGYNLPLATLFQASTISELAGVLTSQGWSPQWSSVVPIQTNGDHRPFFFHGGAADALIWANFAQQLGEDQPFYALQRPDLDGREITQTTVEALATGCLQEMRKIQPQGPYLIGGHCFGGVVAYEMAQQLKAAGEEVKALVLIDSYAPFALPTTPLMQFRRQFFQGLFWVRKNGYYHGNPERWGQLPSKIIRLVRRKFLKVSDNSGEAVTVADAPARAGDVTTAFFPVEDTVTQPLLSHELRYIRAERASGQARDQYQPTVLRNKVALFRAQIQMRDWYFGRELGWQKLVQTEIDLHFIPGFFGNLFNARSLPLLATAVKDYLRTLESAAIERDTEIQQPQDSPGL